MKKTTMYNGDDKNCRLCMEEKRCIMEYADLMNCLKICVNILMN